MKIHPPTAQAYIHIAATSRGPLQTVVIVDQVEAHFRKYRPPLDPDEAVRQALRSAGLRAAMVQLALPCAQPSPPDGSEDR
ncbi:hypothetical protein LJC59_00130 [Desulfovibrio sp. OttesenSCG-928-A18]|nr:hypothetical protein [Desulfovibrio sp. OttesenSCG-928-A18]